MARNHKLLATTLLAAVALALPASSAAAAAPCANAAAVPSAANVKKVEKATLCLLNRERAKRRLPRLTSNGELRKAARGFSTSMVRQNFFDHVSPSGSTLRSRVRGQTSYLRGKIRSWSLGENLAWGSGRLGTPALIVRAWMRSSKHRRNILNRRFRHIGIGVVTGAPSDVQGRPSATYTTNFGSRILRR